jgi:hypothetical protein
MNHRLLDAVDRWVNVALADDPFPLTPTLSLGEREKTPCFMVHGFNARNRSGNSLPIGWGEGKRREFMGIMQLVFEFWFSLRRRLRQKNNA